MIDLHCHSTCSDGSMSPAQLAEAGASFTLHAITDHDNCDGAERFLTSPVGAAQRLVGVELSVAPGAGYEIFHLLGLGVDPTAVELVALLDEIRDGRNARNQLIHQRLAELGMAFEFAELLKYANGKIIARPHFARVLMDHGWATSVKDAFARLLAHGAAAYVPRYRPDPARAIAAIHASGGIAVMAHPRYWTHDYSALVSGLKHLYAVGLDGLEAYYQANLPEETLEHLRAAKSVGLLVTAGSDFHGEVKPEISIGMTIPEEAACVAALLERLAEIRRNR